MQNLGFHAKIGSSIPKRSQATKLNECQVFDSLLRILQPSQLYFLFSVDTIRSKALYIVAIQHFPATFEGSFLQHFTMFTLQISGLI